MGEPSLGIPPTEKLLEDRLDSWKEIAAYLNRDVTTVQRWEKREGMPVHRHLHDKMWSVYASRTDLDAWVRSRNIQTDRQSGNSIPPSSPDQPPQSPTSFLLSRGGFLLLLAAVAAAYSRHKSLDSKNGAFLAKPHSRCPISDSHRVRWIGTGRRRLTRRPFHSVSVRPGRTDGRLGHAARFGRVSQPDPRKHKGNCQSIDPNSGVLTRWFSRDVPGFS